MGGVIIPPKVTVEKKDIVQAALEIIRKEGYSSLTARSLAENLGTSAKPIYRVFENMEALEKEVLEYCTKYSLNYVLSYNQTDYPFYNIGRGIIQFAKEERHLFSLIFLSGKIKMDFTTDTYILDIKAQLERMKQEDLIKDMTEEQHKELLIHMWVYTLGIASLIATNNIHISEEQIRDMLNTAFWGFRHQILQ